MLFFSVFCFASESTLKEQFNEAKEGSSEECEAILALHKILVSHSDSKMTALHFAVKKKSLPSVETLLALGVPLMLKVHMERQLFIWLPP